MLNLLRPPRRLARRLAAASALAAASLGAAPEADAQTPVLVSEFEPRDKDAAGFASLLRFYLSDALRSREELQVVDVESAPEIQGYSALLYLQSCPPGEYVGCAFVVGQMSQVDFAVTGAVQALSATENRVEISIVDVVNTRTALSFQMDVGVGDDEKFIAGIADLLIAVIEGQAGQSLDIRDDEDAVEVFYQTALDNEAVARELEELQGELGEITTLDAEINTEISRKYTLSDLSEDMNSEATKPWERLDMTPTEYLRYKNSGLNLQAWRRAAAGRKNQLLIRGAGGFARAAVDGSYYGRYAVAYEGSDWVTLETYAWQSVQTGNAGRFGGWLGWGLTPTLEVSLGGGYSTGRFYVDINRDTADISSESDNGYDLADSVDRDSTSYVGGSYWGGARVAAALFPVSRVRPLVGGGATYTYIARMPVLPPEDLGDRFPASTLIEAQALLGVEATLGPRLDLYAALPVGFLVAGNVTHESSSGLNLIPNKEPVPQPAAISAGVEIGFTVRLFGVEVDDGGIMEFDDFDDSDEEIY